MNFTNELYFKNLKVQPIIDKHVIFMLDHDMLQLLYYSSPNNTNTPHMHVFSYKSDDIFKIGLPPSLDSALLKQLLIDPSRKYEIIDCTINSSTSLTIFGNG